MRSLRSVVPTGDSSRHAGSTGTDTTAAQASLHPLPLGATILEPDLHLDLRQLQSVSDVRPLRETEVLLRVELALQLQQLLRSKGRTSASRFVVTGPCR